MLKAIIVEDNNDTRLGLIDMVDWNNMGISFCGSAVNGRLGVELARRVRPNLAILDVRMPVLDGIECAWEIRKFLPQCIIIFLSAYSDKEYLKEAIKLHAVDYLEKPVDLDELTQLLKRITKDYEITQIWKGFSPSSSGQWHKIIAKTKDYIDLWINNRLDEEQFISWVSRFHVNMDPNGYFQSFYTECKDGNSLDIEISMKVYDACSTSFTDTSFIIFPYKIGVLTIAQSHNRMKKEYAYAIAEKINSLCRTLSNSPCATAFAMEGMGFRNVSWQFKTLKKRIQLSLKYSDSIIITPDMSHSSKSKLSQVHIDYMLHLVSSEKTQSALYELENLKQIALEAGDEDIKRVQMLFIHLYFYIHNIFSDKGIIELKDLFEEIFSNLKDLQNLSIPELILLCSDKLQILSKISDNKAIKDARVRQAILYMQSNYAEDLSLDNIAENVGLSSAYLSNIFKKETGKNVTQYLEDIRITKAFSMLCSSDLAIAEIAKTVGYQTPHYFTSVFKKVTGILPSQCRR